MPRVRNVRRALLRSRVHYSIYIPSRFRIIRERKRELRSYRNVFRRDDQLFEECAAAEPVNFAPTTPSSANTNNIPRDVRGHVISANVRRVRVRERDNAVRGVDKI